MPSGEGLFTQSPKDEIDLHKLETEKQLRSIPENTADKSKDFRDWG